MTALEKKNALYRAKGIWVKTGRDSYLTTVWRNSRSEAAFDAHNAHGYRNVRIISKPVNSFFDEINSGERKRLPKRSSW